MPVRWQVERSGIGAQLNTRTMHCVPTIIMSNLSNITMVSSLQKNIVSNAKLVVLVKVTAAQHKNSPVLV